MESDATPAKQAIRALVANIQAHEKQAQTAAEEWASFVDLLSTINQLEDAQAPFGGATDVGEATQCFLQWLETNGIRADGQVVAIEEYGVMGKGLVAKRDLKAGELMVRVPSKLFMSTATAMASPQAEAFGRNSLMKSQPNVLLAAHLLAERRNPNSFWQPYIASLPTDFTTPLWWTAKELQTLTGTAVLAEAMAYTRHIVKLYIMINMDNESEGEYLGADLSYAEFKWAISIVMTRQNQVPIDGQPCMTLIPLWDLSNHADGQITSFYNDEEGCIECSAMNHFAAGQQVAMFYGPRTTAEFLLYSGFVPTPNTYDTLSLVLGVSTRDKLFAKKQQVLKMVSMPITLSFKLPRDVSLLGLPVELVAFLRVYTSNEMELDVLAALSRERFTEHFQQDVGALASDKEWIKFLRMRCQLLAMKYKPGQAQPADVGDVAWALAETVKANEKQILDTYIAHLSRLANT